MYNPTTRLLTILEILQSRGEVSGRELAQKLEVEERSVRRYIMMLRDIGIPIESERGRHGGYTLGHGFRLPPLMFNADEITAVMIGLMLMRELGSTPSQAIESATAKIGRVLPADLREAANALRQHVVLDDVQYGTHHAPSEWIDSISRAAYTGHCLQVVYATGGGGTTERLIAPYGLVLHARTWYVPAYCYLREDLRVFRLDRMRAIHRTATIFTRRDGFDSRTFVLESLARMSGAYTAEVILHVPLDTAREVVAPDMGILEAYGSETLMRCTTDAPDWLARYLVRTHIRFTALGPDALREALRELAAELMDAAGDR